MRPKETKEVVEMIKRIENGGGSVDIATEINENSTNEQAAGAKAVYDFATEISPFPSFGNTEVWLKKGDIITIDLDKLADVIKELNLNFRIERAEDIVFGIGDETIRDGSISDYGIFGMWFDEVEDDEVSYEWYTALRDDDNNDITGEGTTSIYSQDGQIKKYIVELLKEIGGTITGKYKGSTYGKYFDLGKMAWSDKESGTDPYYIETDRIPLEYAKKFLTITRPSE